MEFFAKQQSSITITHTRICTPHTLTHLQLQINEIPSVSLPFSWAAQPGAWGPSLCWDMVLIPPSSLQLIWTSRRWGYIIIWHPPTSCERHNSLSIQPLDSQCHPPDIFDRMHLLFTQMHFFFWQLGRGQYATIPLSSILSPLHISIALGSTHTCKVI